MTELMINGFIIGAQSRKIFVKLGRLGKKFLRNVKPVAFLQHVFYRFWAVLWRFFRFFLEIFCFLSVLKRRLLGTVAQSRKFSFLRIMGFYLEGTKTRRARSMAPQIYL